jgi:hypothetical protein
MTVKVRVPHGQTTAIIPGVTIAAADIDSNAVEAAKIAASAVITAKIAADAVTGPKISPAALKFIPFTGKNLAGACTATGLKVGDKVVGVINITDSTNDDANFEATISVADQIQQSAASNLSAKKFALLVVVKS